MGRELSNQTHRLQPDVGATCLECGDWTVQTAAVDDLVGDAREAADRLSGTILTERQALAYLLRAVVGLDRETVAEAMETSASNVDNLHRRGREKVRDARRVVDDLRVLSGEHPGPETS